MKLNIVQGLYIVKDQTQIQEKFKVFTVKRYKPRPTLYHNYIHRIYLKNYSIITPTLESL